MPIARGHFAPLLDHLHEGVVILDLDRRIVAANQSIEQLTGYHAGDLVGASCFGPAFVRSIDRQGEHLCLGERCPALMAMETGDVHVSEVFFLHRDGYRIPIQLRAVPLVSTRDTLEGVVLLVVEQSKGLQAAHRRIAELELMAMSDPLTGLANRRGGEQEIRTRLQQLKDFGRPFGVLFIDIDHFKRVNDIHGHGIGDKVLGMIGATLTHAIGCDDLACRWGGEEFVVIAHTPTSRELARTASILTTLVERSGYPHGDTEVKVTVSIGATLATVHDTLSGVVGRADEYMYQSKRKGRNRITMKGISREVIESYLTESRQASRPVEPLVE